MGDLTVGGGGSLPDLPNFSSLDLVWPAFGAAREAAALAREATPDLLNKLNQAIELRECHAGALELAFRPATKRLALAYLGLLMKAMPYAGQADAKIFGGLLLEDVMSLTPSSAAVEMACRRWRRREKFLPAISEMLKEIAAAEIDVQGAKDFLGRLVDVRDRIARDVDKSG